ncbi:MAG: hypothetical protein KME64_12345 [Scytonematopsis contorta HA4267-MV1]|jgi:hypothetical protein|nr:hypothetical protein [Scytonematopsis contorta HA4267-MV1]
MILIRQATLHHYDKTSTNIHELDLCQVDDNLYIINYIAKYHNSLKSGEVTTQDLPLEEAQQLFNIAIQKKTQEGYILISDERFLNLDLRVQVVLDRLANNKPSNWKLERAIWRAGELKVKEAELLLINFIGTDTPLRDYCIAWALGLCGSSNSVSTLLRLYNSDSPEFVQQIAFEAILKLADPATINNLKFELINSLPKQIQILVLATSSEIFVQLALKHPYDFFTIADLLYQLDNKYARSALINILRTAPFQPNYFSSIRRIFKIAEYRRDAEIFAVLAYRFEKTPGNFDNGFVANSWDEEEEKRLIARQRVYDDEQQQDEPIFVYSYQTQHYLRRRVWRTLKALAETGDANYIKMATAVLLEYSDTDAPPVRRSIFDKWDYKQRKVKYPWDAYADYLTFNHILYTNSQRYKFNSTSWHRCKKSIASFVEPDTREEAFPELWQEHPEAVLKLLMESKCTLVRHFAINVLNDCTSFCALLNINTIIKLVYSTNQATAVFGFELALQRLNQEKPNHKLILLLTNRLFPGIDTKTFFLLDKLLANKINLMIALSTDRYRLCREFMKSFFGVCVLHQQLQQLIVDSIIEKLLTFTEHQTEVAKDIIDILQQHFQAQLLKLDLKRLLKLLIHPITEIQEFASYCFEDWLFALAQHEIFALINHQEEEINAIATNMIFNNLDNFNSESLRIYILIELLKSQFSKIDKLVVLEKFQSKFSLEQLVSNLTTRDIVQFFKSSCPIFREKAQQIFLKILPRLSEENEILETIELLNAYHYDARKFALDIFKKELSINLFTPKIIAIIFEIEHTRVRAFSLELLNQYFQYLNSTATYNQSTYIQIIFDFIKILLTDKINTQFCTALSALLQENLSKWEKHINTKIILQLFQSKSSIVKELATFTFNSDLEYFAQEFTSSEIITIANHDIFLVREMGRRFILQNLDNWRNNTEDIFNALQLLESKWQDTRDFGFKIFTTELTASELTPIVLTRICDSPKQEVRKLGRDLLTRCDSSIPKSKYLLQFSEHPSSDMQTFVTNYLDFAANNPQQLRALVPYFNTVLSKVNGNSSAKKRIFSFLEKEAQKSEESAMIIAEIMTRQSATMVKADKVIAIEIMLKIKKIFPHLELAINIKDVVEKRGKGIRTL